MCKQSHHISSTKQYTYSHHTVNVKHEWFLTEVDAQMRMRTLHANRWIEIDVPEIFKRIIYSPG